MRVAHIEVLVEEPSMGAALRLLLPRMVGRATWQLHEHRSKSQLLRSLPIRLAGYRSWLPNDHRIVVVVDRDTDDCTELKERLETMAHHAGFATRAKPARGRFSVVNRVVVEELEAWYFGDWQAVRTAYPRVKATVPSKAPFRSPDAITGGTWEAFERVMQDAGYFKTGLRKIEAARNVASHMDPSRNTSPSFQALRTALLEMVAA